MKKIDDNISKFRELLKMDQKTFAEKSDIDLNRLIRIEEGKVDMTLLELSKISGTFCISADYLLGATDKPCPIFFNEQQEKIWNLLSSLDNSNS